MKLQDVINNLPKEIRYYTSEKKYAPDEAIIRKGDKVERIYILTEGKVRVSNEFNSGHRYSFDQMSAPTIMGDLEVLAGQDTFAVTNEAITNCTVLSMRASVFLDWLKKDNELCFLTAQIIAAKMYPTSDNNGHIKFLPSIERLESYLAKRLGDLDTSLFVLHTGRQQIADDIGTSVKTVNRGVLKLKEDGIITLQHGKIALNREQQKRLRELVSLNQ